MIHLLSEVGREVLRAAARERAVLALDFDGTLAPLVDDPDAARLPAYTASLLRAAALLFHCAVVSGRARADLAARLAGVPSLELVGNHGAERGGAALPEEVRARVGGWASAMRAALAATEGVEVEEKGWSLAVHYRRARAPEEARRRVRDATALLPGARVFGGHAVVNVTLAGAPTKADAIRSLAARFPSSPLLFVGDDETDEDAFGSPLVTWGVRVGPSDRTAARYYVRDRSEIDTMLWALVSERARAAGLGERWQELAPARNAGGIE